LNQITPANLKTNNPKIDNHSVMDCSNSPYRIYYTCSKTYLR